MAMIKFRNPGSNIETQVQIMRILDTSFYGKVFDLSDFARATTDNNLMTAYGYTGKSARTLSNVSDESRNSTKMNVKMYAEVFRMLGWVSSFRDGASYPLVITELGHYIANSIDSEALYRECILGINSPQEIMPGVKYDEHVRFFLCALRTMQKLDGIMYKHELCMGPMSVSDTDQVMFNEMLQRLREIRGDYAQYNSSWKRFCADQGMKPTSVDNQTRFPVGALYGCGWVEKVQSRNIYPPKSLQCIRLTDAGKETLSRYGAFKDLRLDEFNKLSQSVQDSLIRIGFYSMLQRAGYDTTPVSNQIEADMSNAQDVLRGKALLFSPFQTLKLLRVNKALGLETLKYDESKNDDDSEVFERNDAVVTKLIFTEELRAVRANMNPLAISIIGDIKEKAKRGLANTRIVQELCEDERDSNQDRFYPLVGALFEILGYNCLVSRQGDNGARWDAIITTPYPAIPIEIKSPGEEEHISIKAVKQALENKIILLSRKTYETANEATSLVVGYKSPNKRAEVSSLIEAFYDVYGFKVAVISLDVLYALVVAKVLDGKSITAVQLDELKGLVGVEA